MEPVGLLQLHVLETELADPQFWALAIFFRVGSKIPRFNFEPSYLNPVDVFHLEQDSCQFRKDVQLVCVSLVYTCPRILMFNRLKGGASQ